jgi:hypothetical protein
MSKDLTSSPPSFDDAVPTVSQIKSPEKQPIETKSEIKKKSSTLALCSCFGNKSTIPKEKTLTIAAPKASLPEIKAPIPSSNISSTLKTKGPLRAPCNDLPEVDLTPKPIETIHLPAIHIQDKKQKSTNETKEQVPTPPSVTEKIKVKSKAPSPPPEEIKVKSKTSSPPVDEIKVRFDNQWNLQCLENDILKRLKFYISVEDNEFDTHRSCLAYKTNYSSYGEITSGTPCSQTEQSNPLI